MIKRALGLFLDADADGPEDDNTDEEGVSQEAKKKLTRRLIPGAMEASTFAKTIKKGEAESKPEQKARKTQNNDEPEEDDDDDDEADEGMLSDDSQIKWGGEDSDEEGSDDEHPEFLEAEKDASAKENRGKFKCELCHDKVIMNEQGMEAHLQSKDHLRNVRNFERAKEIGVDAYIAECENRRQEKLRIQDGLSKKALKRQQYFEKLKTEPRKSRKELRKLKTERLQASITNGENRTSEKKLNAKAQAEKNIELMKARFQEKKARRLARKAQAQDDATAQHEMTERHKVKKKNKSGPLADEPRRKKSKKDTAADVEDEAEKPRQKKNKLEPQEPEDKKPKKDVTANEPRPTKKKKSKKSER